MKQRRLQAVSSFQGCLMPLSVAFTPITNKDFNLPSQKNSNSQWTYLSSFETYLLQATDLPNRIQFIQGIEARTHLLDFLHHHASWLESVERWNWSGYLLELLEHGIPTPIVSSFEDIPWHYNEKDVSAMEVIHSFLGEWQGWIERTRTFILGSIRPFAPFSFQTWNPTLLSHLETAFRSISQKIAGDALRKRWDFFLFYDEGQPTTAAQYFYGKSLEDFQDFIFQHSISMVFNPKKIPEAMEVLHPIEEWIKIEDPLLENSSAKEWRLIHKTLQEEPSAQMVTIGLCFSTRQELLKQALFAHPLMYPHESRLRLSFSLWNFIWESSETGWEEESLLGLLTHPLIQKVYPRGTQLYHEKPEWIPKAVMYLEKVTSPLKEHQTGSHSLTCWLDIHEKIFRSLRISMMGTMVELLDILVKKTAIVFTKKTFALWMTDLYDTFLPKRLPQAFHDRLYFWNGEPTIRGSASHVMFCGLPHFLSLKVLRRLFPSYKDSFSPKLYRKKTFLSIRQSTIVPQKERTGIEIAEETSPITFKGLQSISLSHLQLWLMDSKAFYRRCILRVRPFELTKYQRWGTAIHALMEVFIPMVPLCKTVEEAFQCIKTLAKDTLPVLSPLHIYVVERMLWHIAMEEWTYYKEESPTSYIELNGSLNFPQQGITLTARADRVDVFKTGKIRLIDYKTGSLPSFISMRRLQTIQLPLEVLMIHQDAFPSLALGGDIPIASLEWIHLSFSKGYYRKRYKQCVETLLKPYKKIVPLWMECLALGHIAPPSRLNPFHPAFDIALFQ